MRVRGGFSTRLSMAVGLLAVVALIAVSASCSSTSSDRGASSSSSAFAVGITAFTAVDTSRPTPANAAQPGQASRSMSVRVWYPATTPGAEEARDDDFASVPDPTPQFDAPPATGSGPYPLIVFSHGLGAFPALYGDLLASWAAAGYVVAAPAFPLSNQDAPGGPDAGDVSNQPADVAFVISRIIELSSGAQGRARGESGDRRGTLRRRGGAGGFPGQRGNFVRNQLLDLVQAGHRQCAGDIGVRRRGPHLHALRSPLDHRVLVPFLHAAVHNCVVIRQLQFPDIPRHVDFPALFQLPRGERPGPVFLELSKPEFEGLRGIDALGPVRLHQT